MLSKNEIKYLKSLRQSKFRQKYNKFVVENEKTALEFLKSDRYTKDTILVLPSFAKNYRDILDNYGKQVRVIPDKEMEQISLFKSYSSIHLTVDIPENALLPTSMKGYYLYLDNVQDPGNVGTIIRIADWYGMNGVIRSLHSADFYNPKTIQATMGSMVNVNLYSATFDDLPTSISTYGALLDGDNIASIRWEPSGILIIGNEGKGISPAILPQIKHKVYIPGSKDRIAESLNAAMATGIIVQQIFSSLESE